MLKVIEKVLPITGCQPLGKYLIIKSTITSPIRPPSTSPIRAIGIVPPKVKTTAGPTLTTGTKVGYHPLILYRL